MNGTMTDEELMAILAELGSTDQQLGDMDSQIAMARQLRNTPQADPTVQAGRSVVPNYAGAINQVIQSHRGRTQEKDLSAQRDALLGQQTEARKAYGQALLGQPKKPRTLEEELLAMRMPVGRF